MCIFVRNLSKKLRGLLLSRYNNDGKISIFQRGLNTFKSSVAGFILLYVFNYSSFYPLAPLTHTWFSEVQAEICLMVPLKAFVVGDFSTGLCSGSRISIPSK